MKRIAQLLVVSLFALGAQTAWSEQVPADRYHGQSTMEELRGNGVFPGRGGPIDG